MKALLDAGRKLDGNRPLPELFSTILGLAVKSVGAQRGLVLVLDNGELQPKAAKGEHFLIPSAVRDHVMEQRQSLLTGDTSLDHNLRGSNTIVGQRIKSLIAVPLQTNDKVIGFIYVDSPDFMRPFTYDDLTMLTVMANIAAVRIEHARLADEEKEKEKLAEELRRAAEIQSNLLPRSAPEVPGLDFYGFSLPCRSVGGDYYDFLPLPDGRWAVVIGDVAGKGMPAALMMSSLQARVQLLFEQAGELGGIVTRLNRAVAASCPGNRFITFFVAVIDPSSGVVEYCNAGHNPPYLVGAGGTVDPLVTGGPVLGILQNFSYSAGFTSLDPGDTLIMFTDGVTEARSAGDDEYGEERVLAQIAALRGSGAREIASSIYEDLERFMGVAPAADDVTLVVAHRSMTA
jgi:serine phosphatase RsbU (regulator of sigma subunit)